MKIKTAAELRNRPTNQTPAEHYSVVDTTASSRWAAMCSLMNTSEVERRGLHASEQREYDEHEAELDALKSLAGAIRDAHPEVVMNNTNIDRSKLVPAPGSSTAAAYAPGQPLRAHQTVAGYLRARNQVSEDQEGLSLRAMLRGISTGDWHGGERVLNAMQGGVGSAGGFMVPTLLSAEVIDLARNTGAVFKAGARVIPMENKVLDVAKWTGDPVPAWHTEAGVISPSDATMGKVTLTAHTLAGLTIVSRELLEDADGVEDELRSAFAADFALTVDKGALYGSGTAPEIQGLKNTATVPKTALAANGATPSSWDWLVDSVGRLADLNETANGVIYSPRTARTLAKLKDTTQQPLTMPDYLDAVDRYQTNQVGNSATVGTSSNTSDAFAGDWTQLYVGVRTQLTIQVLTERFADTGQIGFLTWWRGDVQAARASAFDITTGILP